MEEFVTESERNEIEGIWDRWVKIYDAITSSAGYTIELGQDLGLEPPDASDYLM